MKAAINYDDFSKLDVRAGKVVSASWPEWSSKLLRMEIDLGDELGKRILFSGIRAWYSPEMVEGKIMPVIINMEPKKMGDEESQGMIIMVDTEEKPVLIFLDESVPLGSVVR